MKAPPGNARWLAARHFPLLHCFPLYAAGFLKAAVSAAESPFKRAFHLQSTSVEGVGATPGLIDVSNYFSLPPSLSRLYLSVIRQVMNQEAARKRNATTTLT